MVSIYTTSWAMYVTQEVMQHPGKYIKKLKCNIEINCIKRTEIRSGQRHASYDVSSYHYHYDTCTVVSALLACSMSASQSSPVINACTLCTYVHCLMYPCVPLGVAGANISGDLKNPSVAIPQGTLLACGITFVVYVFLCKSNTSMCTYMYMFCTCVFYYVYVLRSVSGTCVLLVHVFSQ